MIDRAMNDPVLVPGRGSGSLEQLLAEEFPRMLMVQTTSACNSSNIGRVPSLMTVIALPAAVSE